MSPARRNSTGRLRLAPVALGLGVAVALGIAGCGAGQITQTDTAEPAVNGAMGSAGKIDLRDVRLAYPAGGAYPEGGDAIVLGSFVNSGRADDVLLSVSSPVAASDGFNGTTTVIAGRTLVAVGDQGATSSASASSSSSSAASETGSASESVPSSEAGSASESNSSSASVSGSAASSETTSPGTSSPTTTGSATSSVAAPPAGQVVIMLKTLSEPVRSGKTIPITFVFRDNGSVTLQVPIATPLTPLPRTTETPDESGH